MPKAEHGRVICPECQSPGARVSESEKGTLTRYCAVCGSQYHARTDRQKKDLLAKCAPAGPAPEPAPEPAPTPTPAPAATYRPGLFHHIK